MSAPIILRQRSGPIITVIVWAFLVFLLGDALVRGAWETVGRFGPALLLIGWLVYLVLWRPCVRVSDDEVEVRELVRDTTVPFDRISDIRLGTVVTIEVRDSRGGRRTIRPWNAPGSPRRKTDSGLAGGTRPESLESHPSFELLRRWERSGDDHRSVAARSGGADAGGTDGGQAETRLNRAVIAVTAILMLLVVIGVI